MKKRDDLGEQTLLSMERSAFSEERTMLAYIQTELAFLGVMFIIWKLYFFEPWWSTMIAIGITMLFVLLILFEAIKIRQLRKQRKELQKKHWQI